MNPMQNHLFNNLLEELRSGFYTEDTIDLNGYGITDKELDLLLAAIKLHTGVNAQIRVLDLTGHSLNFTAVDGLIGLEELILDNKKMGNRSTTLTLINLPSLSKLHAQHCRLTSLTFHGINTLKEINLSINRLGEINLDPQHGLEELNLFGNSFKKLDFSALHKLQSLDVSCNTSLRELYLGNSPLSQKLSFNSEEMSENSKKQLWARYSTNSEQMNDCDDVFSTNNAERTAEIKNTVRIKESTDLAEFFKTYVTELKAGELKHWMWDAQRTYAYCLIGSCQDFKGWDRVPEVLQKKIIADSLYGLGDFVSKLQQRLLAVLQQFESVVPELTTAFIKSRVNPFIESNAKAVINNFERPKFKAALARLIEDNKNATIQDLVTTQGPEIVQELEAIQQVVIQESTHTSEQSTPASTGCLPTCMPNFKPITWLASSFKTGIVQGGKQFAPKSRKKYTA